MDVTSYIKSKFWDSKGDDCAAEAVFEQPGVSSGAVVWFLMLSLPVLHDQAQMKSGSRGQSSGCPQAC